MNRQTSIGQIDMAFDMACMLSKSPIAPLYSEGCDDFVASVAASIATGRSEQVPGWDLAHTEDECPSRRTNNRLSIRSSEADSLDCVGAGLQDINTVKPIYGVSFCNEEIFYFSKLFFILANLPAIFLASCAATP